MYAYRRELVRTALLGALIVAWFACAASAMAVTGSVSGTVSGTSHPVTVSLWRDYGGGVWDYSGDATVTAANGAFVITGVVPGDYKVSFEDVDYNVSYSQWYSGKNWSDQFNPYADAAAADTVTVGDGQVVAGVNATLTDRPSQITGAIRIEASSTPIPGAQVEAYFADGPDWFVFTWTKSEADGSYRVCGLDNTISGTSTYRIGAFAPGYEGRYYGEPSDVAAIAGAANVSWTGLLVSGRDISLPRTLTKRIANTTRYNTALAVAYQQYTDPITGLPDFSGVTTVTIASGEDRAAADPLAAGGLCWAYQVTDPFSINYGKGSPMVIIQGTSYSAVVTAEVGDLLAQVAADNGGVVGVEVVGGPVSVPDARINELKSYVTTKNGGTVKSSRLLSTGGRYDMAAAIASRIRHVASLSTSDTLDVPTTALVANGADVTKFFDALALSPISSANGYPILLVSVDAVPAQTSGALTALGIPGSSVYVAGGQMTVSPAVLTQLGVPAGNRMAGSTRYSTASTIADSGVARGWLGADGVGVAAKLPDALTGGAALGTFRSPLLVTASDALSAESAAWIDAHKSTIDFAYLFGGERSASPAVLAAMNAALQ